MPKKEIPMRRWVANPRQAEFLKATEDEVLYGGAAGGGKTDALLILAAMRCSEVPGAHVLYMRRAYPDLEMSAIRRSLELFSGTGPTYDASKHRWKWPNGSILQFGFSERDTDVYRYQSAEFGLILFDELTQFTEFQYTYMLSRNRSTKPGDKPLVRAASNPGGVGHAWVKSRFIDVAPPGQTYIDPKTGRTRRFIPAKLEDNPILMEIDPDYIKRLEELPEAERRALKNGDWDIFSGQFFKEFRRDLHVIEPFPIPETYERWRSLDWGYAKPYAYYEYAEDYDGNIYVTREVYGCVEPDVGIRETPAEVAERIGLDIPEWGVADPAIFSKGQDGGKSIAEQFMEAGIHWWPANNDRINGWMEVRRRLKGDGERPSLYIFNTCIHLIRTLPLLVHDEHKPEDLDTKQEDHAADSLRYGLMARVMTPDRPKNDERRLPFALRTDDDERDGFMSWYAL